MSNANFTPNKKDDRLLRAMAEGFAQGELLRQLVDSGAPAQEINALQRQIFGSVFDLRECEFEATPGGRLP